MLVSKNWCEEVSNDIIWEFNNLLAHKEIKINNDNSEDNEFENKDSYINKKDYEKLKVSVTEQIIELVEYAEYLIRDAA